MDYGVSRLFIGWWIRRHICRRFCGTATRPAPDVPRAQLRQDRAGHETVRSPLASWWPALPPGSLSLPMHDLISLRQGHRAQTPFNRGLDEGSIHPSSIEQCSSRFGSGASKRRRTRPRLLHPNGSGPEDVPSSLFTFQPPAGGEAGDRTSPAVTSTATISAVEDEPELLQARLVEESDLPAVSALLAEAFEPSILIDPTELSSEASVERVEKANKYLKEMAYKKILRAIKSRCGGRLKRGDFALTSDALVLAVRDSRTTNTNAGAASAVHVLGGGDDGGGSIQSNGRGSGDAGDIVAVVELTLRQPDGWLPLNGLFIPPTGWEPYMCNLAVAKKYRGNGYGKQLVQLCETVAKTHWGYKRMYLHVDADSPAAIGLYAAMGYETIEQLEPPVWIKKLLGLRDIRYQVKHFDGNRGATSGGRKL